MINLETEWKDEEILFNPNALIAGVDEVGRGALFGSVVAAAVIVPVSVLPSLTKIEVKDSKKISARKRSQLVSQIQELVSCWQIASASVEEIDRLNILQASLLAMKRAVSQLSLKPDICLVDGNYTIPGLEIPQKSLIKGDERSPAIAAASILAKVWRDDLIVTLAQEYSHYHLEENKGYGTKQHRMALKKYGPCLEHRQSFRLQ